MLQCAAGFAPGGEVALRCDEASGEYVPVNRTAGFPACLDCAQGYFRAAPGVCSPCSTAVPCPAGSAAPPVHQEALSRCTFLLSRCTCLLSRAQLGVLTTPSRVVLTPLPVARPGRTAGLAARRRMRGASLAG